MKSGVFPIPKVLKQRLSNDMMLDIGNDWLK